MSQASMDFLVMPDSMDGMYACFYVWTCILAVGFKNVAQIGILIASNCRKYYSVILSTCVLEHYADFYVKRELICNRVYLLMLIYIPQTQAAALGLKLSDVCSDSYTQKIVFLFVSWQVVNNCQSCFFAEQMDFCPFSFFFFSFFVERWRILTILSQSN